MVSTNGNFKRNITAYTIYNCIISAPIFHLYKPFNCQFLILIKGKVHCHFKAMKLGTNQPNKRLLKQVSLNEYSSLFETCIVSDEGSTKLYLKNILQETKHSLKTTKLLIIELIYIPNQTHISRLISKTIIITVKYSGAKLALFNSGGVCQNCPAKTDDALQQFFISGHYFSPKKGQKYFSRHKPVKLRFKKKFSDQYM